MSYDYTYDGTGSFARGADGGYDERTREVIMRNAANSMLMDAERAAMAPTASQLRARARAATAATNGHAPAGRH